MLILLNISFAVFLAVGLAVKLLDINADRNPKASCVALAILGVSAIGILIGVWWL